MNDTTYLIFNWLCWRLHNKQENLQHCYYFSFKTSLGGLSWCCVVLFRSPSEWKCSVSQQPFKQLSSSWIQVKEPLMFEQIEHLQWQSAVWCQITVLWTNPTRHCYGYEISDCGEQWVVQASTLTDNTFFLISLSLSLFLQSFQGSYCHLCLDMSFCLLRV